MLQCENTVFKALYFNLRIRDLEMYYSKENPKGGYARISQFMKVNNFRHEQYSGYHSKFPTTDMHIFDLVRDMQEKMPWLEQCINKFEVTDIGENYNLKKLFTAKVHIPEN